MTLLISIMVKPKFTEPRNKGKSIIIQQLRKQEQTMNDGWRVIDTTVSASVIFSVFA